MNAAPLPINEPKRLRDLRSYGILDTAPEPSFDDATALAAYVCGTPIALVTFVDESRQWFKSHHGLAASETPRYMSFCAHAILHEGLLEVSDAACDSRFSDNPLVTDAPGIRFYAGAPLVTKSGMALGTLCVIDRVPRILTTAQKEALALIAAQVVRTLKLRKCNAELATAMEHLRIRGRIISDQRARLFHAEKMASLGAMCASLSHEINNPLSVVCGRAEQLQMFLGEVPGANDFVVRSLEAIRRSAYRIGGIVKGLRSYGREADGDPFERVALSSILMDLRHLVWERFRSAGVALTFDGEGDGITLDCRPTQILQILFNLVSNAFDAVVAADREGDGRVAVTCSVAKGPDSGEVEIRVNDNGCGIPEDVRGRIMAPFFTTKPAGKGTGLGLAISLSLARAHGGFLALENATPRGTTFLLRLPLDVAGAIGRGREPGDHAFLAKDAVGGAGPLH